MAAVSFDMPRDDPHPSYGSYESYGSYASSTGGPGNTSRGVQSRPGYPRPQHSANTSTASTISMGSMASTSYTGYTGFTASTPSLTSSVTSFASITPQPATPTATAAALASPYYSPRSPHLPHLPHGQLPSASGHIAPGRHGLPHLGQACHLGHIGHQGYSRYPRPGPPPHYSAPASVSTPALVSAPSPLSPAPTTKATSAPPTGVPSAPSPVASPEPSPVAPSARRSITRTPSSRRKVAGAMYASEYHVSFADLLASISTQLAEDDGGIPRSKSPSRPPSPQPVTAPLKVRSRDSLQKAASGPWSRPQPRPNLSLAIEDRSASSESTSTVRQSPSPSSSVSPPPLVRPPRSPAPLTASPNAIANVPPTPPPKPTLTSPTPPIQTDVLIQPQDVTGSTPSLRSTTPSRQGVVHRDPTATSAGRVRRVSPTIATSSTSPPAIQTKSAAALPTSTPSRPASPTAATKRTVRVEMADIDTFLLHWESAESPPDWMASARGYVLDDKRLVLDIHKDTPPDERKYLLKLAFECYLPMRERYLDAVAVLRLSMPGLSLSPLRITPPPPVREMRRSEFKRAGSDPPRTHESKLQRVVLPNPWRSTYRLLHNVATGEQEPLWVPTGVVLNLGGSEGDDAVEKCIVMDSDTADEFRSHTMNAMLVHALRRLTGADVRPPPDIQRAMKRAQLDRLSFHPDKVAVSPVGRYGGVLEVSLPAPRGTTPAPAWHHPVSVYLTSMPATEFCYDCIADTPDWRVEEIHRVVQDHTGEHILAWTNIRRILGEFAPTDPRMARLLVSPPSLSTTYRRRVFVPRYSGSSGNEPLPRLTKRAPGQYALEFADLPPATLDCTQPKPQIAISESAKHVTPMVAWLFGIVAAVFES